MEKQYQTKNIVAGDANTTVIIRRAGDTKTPGEFGYMTILLDSAHTVTFYDGETASGEKICIKPVSLAPGTYWFKRPVSGGLCAVVAASYAGEMVVGFN